MIIYGLERQTCLFPGVPRQRLLKQVWVGLMQCMPFLSETILPKPHPGPLTLTETDLCLGKEPERLFSKNMNTLLKEELEFMQNLPEALCLPMHITSQHRIPKD